MPDSYSRLMEERLKSTGCWYERLVYRRALIL
jgi:hypothetical protein